MRLKDIFPKPTLQWTEGDTLEGGPYSFNYPPDYRVCIIHQNVHPHRERASLKRPRPKPLAVTGITLALSFLSIISFASNHHLVSHPHHLSVEPIHPENPSARTITSIHIADTSSVTTSPSGFIYLVAETNKGFPFLQPLQDIFDDTSTNICLPAYRYRQCVLPIAIGISHQEVTQFADQHAIPIIVPTKQ